MLTLQGDADRAGHYSASLHEAFGDAGFYRILRPERFGGSELGFETSTASCWRSRPFTLAPGGASR